MTTKECYEKMDSNYEKVLGRLGSEMIIKKIAIKFLDDSSFQNLKDALAGKNLDEGQHTH